MKLSIRENYGKSIPYDMVSTFVILRDYADVDDSYINNEHMDLVNIADSLYNVGIDVSEMSPKYVNLYNKYGKEYFDKVLDDIKALDTQVNSNNIDDLIADVNARLEMFESVRHMKESTTFDIGYYRGNPENDHYTIQTPNKIYYYNKVIGNKVVKWKTLDECIDALLELKEINTLEDILKKKITINRVNGQNYVIEEFSPEEVYNIANKFIRNNVKDPLIADYFDESVNYGRYCVTDDDYIPLPEQPTDGYTENQAILRAQREAEQLSKLFKEPISKTAKMFHIMDYKGNIRHDLDTAI